MEQLTQKLKTGDVQIVEVPVPQVGPGMVLVRNHFSMVSGGTEGSTAKSARKGFIGKALDRPDQVKKVLQVACRQGPLATYRAVVNKLEAYSPCGYSSAGEVLEVGAGVKGFVPGDKVACAGVGYASHAEIVSVPVNLVVRLPADADLKLASFNTLGAIAMQGVRQARLQIGESCVVVGLGLIGQLTCQLLHASGVRVIGVDVSGHAVEVAKRLGALHAFCRESPGLESQVNAITDGLGADAVIITAGTSSLDPINFAGQVARKKGRVVVVGAIPTGFDRENYYLKELELAMSCSYGPGRYDPDYEEHGLDYPAAYVRWTQKRNMDAFQQLAHGGRLRLEELISHEFALKDAGAAYDLIVNRTSPFMGIVLRYDISKPVVRQPVVVRCAPEAVATVGIGFIGAGNYAQANLLPNIPTGRGVELVGVMTNSGTTSRRVAERFGFSYSAGHENEIFEDPRINTVFVATRHNSHGSYVAKALAADKNVFVEKPLCLTVDELDAIEQAADAHPKRVMVGFNRRFAPMFLEMRKRLGQGVMAMHYRVNSGAIPANSWIQDRAVGGGRLVGEACHFIDLMTFLCNSVPVEVHAMAMDDPQHLNDVASVQLRFANGSIGTIGYYANGSPGMPKERFEAFHGGVSAVMDDFRLLTCYGKKVETIKAMMPDKGQSAMVAAFLNSIRQGTPSPIPLKDVRAVALASIAAEESIRHGMPVRIPKAG